jgi:CspA family cold shock protein
LNARQRRLFEEARKKNPDLKMPVESEKPAELTEEDLALIKQGVGDKTSRAAQSAGEETGQQTGSVVTYFDDKGFGFVRPDNGGKDVFFHISRLAEGAATDLRPGTKVIYEMGTDRTGKMAASSVRIAPAGQ